MEGWREITYPQYIEKSAFDTLVSHVVDANREEQYGLSGRKGRVTLSSAGVVMGAEEDEGFAWKLWRREARHLA